MRFTIAIASLALLATPARAQRQATLRVDYSESAPTTGAAFVTKAWTDSVNIYFNAELAQHGPTNLVRVAQPRDFTSYRLYVQSIPLMTTEGQPSGVTAYSLTVFRPPAVGNNWQYITSEIGYTRSPSEAASEMVRFLNSSLGAR